MTMRTRTDALLIVGFCAFLFFYGMGQFGLIGADEPRYAQVAREMLEHRDWITPVLGGRPWLEKPPLYYWQAMLVYSIIGVSDVTARVPSAIDATLLVVAVYLFFRRFRRGVEVDAALITASGAGVVGYARAASMDMALAAAFSIGMLAWWAWRESERRIYHAGFYVFMALGMLAKGPVAPCAFCRSGARVASHRPNLVVARHLTFLRNRSAVVHRGRDAESAILPRIHRRAQSGPLLDRSLSPSPALLVLPAGHGGGAHALDTFRDRGVCRTRARLVGGS